MFYFAHAGENHETVTQAVAHSMWTEWYIAIPAFFALLAVAVYLTYRITKKSFTAAFLVALVACFVVGVAAYQTVPALSVICLALGFAGSLLQTLLALGGSQIRVTERQE